MLEQGEHPKVAQETLGHASISQTMNTYSHVTPNMQQAAFVRLGERLKQPRQAPPATLISCLKPILK